MMHKNIRQLFSAFFVLVLIVSLLIIPFAAAQSVDESSVESVVESVDSIVENEVEFNLNVVPVVFSQLVVPCSPVYFEVSVENTGSFDDDVVFSLSPLVGVEITPSEVLLKPGEKQKVMISFVPDDCSVFGDFPLVFTAESQITGLVVELDLSLVVDAADVATVGSGVDRIVAGKSLLSASIPVKNEGSVAAAYKLSVDSPAWVKLDKNEIVVPAGTEKSLLLIINPDESVQYGDYSVILNVASNISDRVYSKSLVVRLAGPTVFSRVISSVGPKFVPFVKTGLAVGAAIIVLFIIIAIIRNRSNRKEDEDFSEDVVVEEDSDVGKEEDETDEIKHTVVDERKLRRDVERELRNNFVLIPKSSVLSPQFLWVKWLVRLFAVAIIVALSILGYSNKSFVLDYLDYFSAGVIIVVLFVFVRYLSTQFRIIKSWKFLAAGDEASFDTGWKKLLKVSFTVKDAVQNLKIKVVKGSRGIQISAGESVYSCVRFATNVTSSAVAEVGFVFKVRKSWLVRHFSSEKDVKVLAFVNNRWRPLDVEIVGSDNKFVFVEAQSPVLVPVAVVGKGKPVVREVVREVVSEDVVEKKKVVHRKKFSFGWLKNFVAYGVLFVLLAVVFAGFAYLSQIEPLPEVTSGIQPQVWLQDTSQTVVLSKFFSDPDGDALSFSAVPVEHVKITFDGSNAVLTPDAGWHGRASTTFSASDGQVSVSSNEVILLVKKRFVPLWVKPYIPQIISGVLFVFVVVILIVFRENILKFLDEGED